jgi:ADP-ribose pyrophosphatase
MAQNFFVYGPLGDPELLGVVLGRVVEPGELVAARAMRCVVRSTPDAALPALVRADGEAAPGALLREASDDEAARLSFFHGAGAAPVNVNVSASGLGEVEAVAFSDDASSGRAGEPWSPEAWSAGRRVYDIEFARDWMSQYGLRPAEDMEHLRAGIGFRAQSRALAAGDCTAVHTPTGLRTGLDRSAVELYAVERPYMEFFSVEEHFIRHRKFDGSMTPELKRAVFFTGDAVTILPYDPALDRVLMIEQWRPGPWARGDARPWCLEVVAGRIDPGETLEETAIREAREEAGVEVTDLQRVGAYYATPGMAAEQLTSFVGRADLSDAGGVHGLDSEDEDIRVLTPTFEEAMAMLEAEEVDNAPAIISLMWLAARRDGLRKRWVG